MHSPVWADIDPNFEMEEFWSDWENYSDDYYDGDTRNSTNVEGNSIGSSPKPVGKRKRAVSDSSRQKKRKREEGIPDLSTGDSLDLPAVRAGFAAPIVIWRAKGSPERPSLHDSEEVENVSVLKDWRERLQNASHIDHRDKEVETLKANVEENENAVNFTTRVALGNSQAPGRKSARLGSRLPAEEGAARATVGFSEENGVPRHGLGVTALPEKPSNKGVMKKPNSKVIAPTKADSRVARSTTGSARSAGGAGQKRKGSESKEENDRASKRRVPSNKQQHRGVDGGASRATRNESGHRP
jgi:hypothetical protein